MSDFIKDTINYNSAYISLNLLDELDYCIGEYGKPKPEFIFSLNTFVESFIACSGFYTSLDELNHLNLTAPAMFPNGRPILNLVVRETGLKFVNGILDNPGNEIYRSSLIGKTKKEAEQEFIKNYGRHLKDKYFLQSDVTQKVEKIPFVTSRFDDSDFVISEVLNSSYDLVSNLINVSTKSSIQTTLPLSLFTQHINNLSKSPYSINALELIAKMHNSQIDELRKQLGYQYLPIPPFTNILLSQLNNISDIPRKLSQLRSDFHELRSKFIEMEKNIFEADSMKEQLDAKKYFDEFWVVFNKKYVNKSHRIFYGVLDSGSNADVDKGVDSILENNLLEDSIKEINYGKILGNVVSKGYNWNKERRIINRFKGITNIWELFQDSKSITQQLHHFERVFGIKYSSEELDKVHQYVNRNIININGLVTL